MVTVIRLYGSCLQIFLCLQIWGSINHRITKIFMHGEQQFYQILYCICVETSFFFASIVKVAMSSMQQEKNFHKNFC